MFIVEKDNKIILADEDRATIENTLKFMPDYAGCEIVETDRPIVNLEFADTEEYRARMDKQARQDRIAELKQMLADSDYVVIKIASGVATADDYSEILNSRKAWRAEINELELVANETVD